MKHLSDEQLGARLDGELPEKVAGAVERHLAECSLCRERLAALSGADASLARALQRDPGEAYFESFADRVQARIAAGAASAGPSEARAADAAPRGNWFGRPSTLAWAGAAVTLVAVAVFALQFANQPEVGSRFANERKSIVGADGRDQAKERANAQAAPEGREADALERSITDSNVPGAGARADDGALRSRMAQGSALDARSEPHAPAELQMSARTLEEEKVAGAKNETSTPSRMQPVRTLPSGEQAPAQPSTHMRGGRSESFAAPPIDAAKSQKPPASPMSAATPAPAAAPPAAMGKSADAETQAKRADEQVQKQKLAAAAPAPQPTGALSQASGLANGVTSDADVAARFKLCGKVTNSQGRTVAGATVTVVETGRSITSGADGSFCVEAPSPGATLSVLSLGYQEYRAKVSEEVAVAPLAVTLRSVETLGPGTAPTARLETVPAPVTAKAYDYSSKSLAGKDAAKPGVMASIPALPGETPDATAARHAREAAMRSNSPLLWSTAGGLWSGVATSAKTMAAANEARYRTAEARMHSWRLTHAAADRTAASAALDAFLAKAPAGEQRRFAESWRGELTAR